MKLEEKKKLAQKRRWRIRKKIKGTAERPRLSVRFTGKHIYAQCIDDDAGKTLVSASTLAKDLRDQKMKPNLEGARALGKLFAEKLSSAGHSSVVFDRGGRRYHGVVEAFATAARQGGLSF